MQIVEAGHQYELDHLEGGGKEHLVFVQKKMGTDGLLETVVNGTTNEEVLRVLIDRIKTLNGVLPCRENSIAITKLEETLMWLEKRTADRRGRNVEGTNHA